MALTEQERESHRRYIAKILADPVRREQYFEKRKESGRRFKQKHSVAT